jgi:hypothetical protein
MSVQDLTGAVDGGKLMRHCEEFAKRVKLSGTPEERESFLYLKSCLDDYSYKTELLEHDAYISLPGASRVEANGRSFESITHSFSRPSPAGGLKAKLVDLGDGKPEDFAAKDCRGAVVLVNGIASPAIAARARDAGAAGQLHVSPHEHLHEMCISPVWGNPSDETIGQMPTTVACTISKADGAVLREALAAGQVEVTLHSEVDTGWRKTPILVGEIEAPEGADTPFVLLSGHHDTWYYGVMDNGSANATMLEAARLLAGQRSALKRGLRVCFWSGHSHGRYSGSTWYIDRNWRDFDRRCAAHVNVDSTGGVGATVLTENGVVASLVDLAREVIQTESGQRHSGKRPSRSSDQSFWGVGIPSMYGSVSEQPLVGSGMRNALGWWWHTPHDLLDKIDRDFLVRDTRIVLHTLWRLLTDRVLPVNPGREIETLVAELGTLAGKGGADLVGEVKAAAEMLAGKAAALAKAATTADEATCAKIDRAIIKLSRALIPLDYTSGNRFAHDPALPQPAWPALQPLRALAAAEPGSDKAKFLTVSAVRARNRVLAALEEGARAVDQALAG